jgi:hypothetical protein
MKLKLKVFDPTIKELSFGDKIRNHIIIKDNNSDRWNREVEININEKLILDLTEHIINTMSENKMFVIDAINRFRVPSIMLSDIDKIIKSARAWKSIQIKLANMKYSTSRFTRISLFEELLNQKKIKASVQDSIEAKINSKTITPTIPPVLEKIEEIEPVITDNNKHIIFNI